MLREAGIARSIGGSIGCAQERLALTEGEPVIVAWRRAFDHGGAGRALEVTVRVINPALHELVYRYA